MSHDRCLREWGKKLLEEFPAGVTDEPDFERDGTARMLWFAKGFAIGLEWASEIGMAGKVWLGKTYDNPSDLDNAGKAEFARRAFELARTYSGIAKAESDMAADHEAQRRKALAEIDRQVESLRSELVDINSRETLRIRVAKAKEESAAAKASNNLIDQYAYSQRISTLQDRLIAIEAQEARRSLSGWWITLIGTATGIAGLVVGFFAGSSCPS